MERSGGDQGPLQLDAEFLRHFSKRRQASDALPDALEVVAVERVLRIEQAKHSQRQRVEERVHGGPKVEVRAEVVGPQVGKQGREDVCVLLVELAVGPREHVV